MLRLLMQLQSDINRETQRDFKLVYYDRIYQQVYVVALVCLLVSKVTQKVIGTALQNNVC